jgi:hypothetical protein
LKQFLLVQNCSSRPLVELARRLELDKSAVSRRVAKAVERGYLDSQEKTKGKPAKLVIGDSLPDEALVLPDPVALGRCTLQALTRAQRYTPLPPTPSRSIGGQSSCRVR